MWRLREREEPGGLRDYCLEEPVWWQGHILRCVSLEENKISGLMNGLILATRLNIRHGALQIEHDLSSIRF